MGSINVTCAVFACFIHVHSLVEEAGGSLDRVPSSQRRKEQQGFQQAEDTIR